MTWSFLPYRGHASKVRFELTICDLKMNRFDITICDIKRPPESIAGDYLCSRSPILLGFLRPTEPHAAAPTPQPSPLEGAPRSMRRRPVGQGRRNRKQRAPAA